MTRSSIVTVLGSFALMLCAAAQAQNAPASSSTAPPPDTSSSPPPSSSSSSDDSSMSATKPSAGQKDTSRSAKEQQSHKQKCPKNGDTSNVNCKETGPAPK